MLADYLFALFPLLMLLGLYAGLSVAKQIHRNWQQPFMRYAAEMASSGLPGQVVARRLLDGEGLLEVPVSRSSRLNHYRPWRRQVCLNPAAFDEASLSATAVAAHEVGHALQFARGYLPARLWRLLWPICVILAVAGLVPLASEWGEPVLANFGLLTMMPAFIVAQVLVLNSLLLEHDASRRAKKLVQESGLISIGEQRGFNLMLKNAFLVHAGRVGCFVSLILVLPILHIDWIAWFSEKMGSHDAAQIAPAPIPAPVSIDPGLPQEILEVELDIATPVLGATAILLVILLLPILRRAKARRVGHHCKVGRTLQNRGDIDGAVASYSEAVRLDRGQVGAYLGRGTAFMQMGQLDKALADMDAAIALAPAVAGLLTARASIHALCGNYDQALHDYDQALRLVPESSQALVGRGNLWLVRRDLARSAADFELALACNPKNAHALRGRSQLWLSKGDLDRAMADIQQAFAFGGVNPDFYAVRGHIHADRKDYDAALSDMNEACRLSPDRSDLLRDRGLIRFWKEEFDQAIADLNEAIRINPRDATALNNRGAAFLKKGEYAAAIVDLQQSIDLRPNFPNPCRHLAWIEATCPDRQFLDGQQAVANAFRALELAEWKPVEWLGTLAAAHAENGDFEAAVKWQTKCLDESPAEARAELEDALVLYQSQKPLRDYPPARPRPVRNETRSSHNNGDEADVEHIICT